MSLSCRLHVGEVSRAGVAGVSQVMWRDRARGPAAGNGHRPPAVRYHVTRWYLKLVLITWALPVIILNEYVYVNTSIPRCHRFSMDMAPLRPPCQVRVQSSTIRAL
jgi:hypothetical protein